MSLLPSTRAGALWRFLLAAVLIIAATAATTAVAGLLEFQQVANYFNVNPALFSPAATVPTPGQPQTLLIIGSDHRAGTPFTDARTDTMMLVRLNGSSQTINVMSLPRDLQVTIPGYGVSKLNAAYSAGGPNLLIKTIQRNVFPHLHVNHIIDVNFAGFRALVYAIGCVYSDIDHRYLNNTALTGYSSIDIQPGYQKLCGAKALQFVRFRHSDSDIVRNARQQDFIRWAKDQYGIGQIIANKDRLLKIFAAHTQTDHDLHTTDGLINLFNLVAFSGGHRIKQVKFPAQLQPCTPAACFVTASSSAEATVFDAFMRPTTSAPASHQASPPTGGGHHRRHLSSKVSTAGLTSDTSDGKSQAAALHGVGMPVYYPRLILAGSNYCSDQTSVCPLEQASPGSYPRGYTIVDQQGKRWAAYRMTLAINPVLGQYYGVQGTAWPHPPLIASPNLTKNVAGRHLLIFEQGGSITNVAWRTPHGVYWISNSLTSDISNGEMINIAASLTR